jgi:two-component system sensor histidine kinase QseC
MKRYLSYFGPSLIRRVVIAILLAFSLAWVAIAIYGYWETTEPVERDRQLIAHSKILVTSLASLTTEGEARAAISTASHLVNASMRENKAPVVILFQLNDLQGRQIFFSPEGGAGKLTAGPTQLSDAEVNGQLYRVYSAKTSHWELILAMPVLNSRWLFIMLVMQIAVYMLIALPIFVLTIWFAVARGLRPLQLLSKLIADKNKDDLSPLNFSSPYAELKPLTAALDRLLSQLRSKIEREHAFVQDAAHELRTPMAVISAQAHVLTLAETAADRDVAEKNLELAINRSSHLIAQLLEMSHIDNDKLVASEAIDVAALLQQELARLAPTAIARQIELSFDAPDTLFNVVDANAVQSIVQNLLNNAILYVGEGDQIEVELRQVGELMILTVADDGPGIAEADRERIFERFYRGAGHDVAGTGLGLAIVAQAVARLNGTIQLSTGLHGRGCRFIVEVPLRH